METASAMSKTKIANPKKVRRMTALEQMVVCWWGIGEERDSSTSWGQVSDWAYGAQRYARRHNKNRDGDALEFLHTLACQRAIIARSRI